MFHCKMGAVSESILNKYFDLLENTLSQCDLIEHPAQIFNLNEIGFPLSPKAPLVVARKGTKHLTGHEKSQIIVLACESTSGNAILPLVILNWRNVSQLSHDEIPDTRYAYSTSD